MDWSKSILVLAVSRGTVTVTADMLPWHEKVAEGHQKCLCEIEFLGMYYAYSTCIARENVQTDRARLIIQWISRINNSLGGLTVAPAMA